MLARHELVDLEADLLRRRREHDDVVCAGLERAPEEAVGRPVPEHHHVELGVLAGHSVQEQQGAVRIAGAGDEEQVRDAAAEPRQRLFGAGDDADDLEVLAAAGSESFTSSASTPGSTARSACTGRLGMIPSLDPFYLSTVAAFACDGFVGLAPTTGRRTKISCVLSAA